MKKINKWILISLGLIFTGAGLLITGFLLGGRIYSFELNANGFQVYASGLENSSSVTYDEQTVALEPFDHIETDTEFVKISVIPSDSYGISYKVSSQSDFSYEVTGKTLKVREQFKNIGRNVHFQWFSIGSDGSASEEEYLEIYIPADAALGDISIHTDYCDISLDDLRAKEVSVQSDYGDIYLRGLSVSSLNAETQGADIEIENTTGDTLMVNNVYGNVELSDIHFNDTCSLTAENGCFEIDTAYFHLWEADTTYGDLTGNDISCDSASLNAQNGTCKLKSFTVNSLTAESSYGDISLQLTAPAKSYGYDLTTKYGSIDVEGFDSDVQNFIITPADSSKQIIMNYESGNIKISGS